MKTFYQIEQSSDGNWEPVTEGDFEIEADAIAGMTELQNDHGWRGMRITERTDDDGFLNTISVICYSENANG